MYTRENFQQFVDEAIATKIRYDLIKDEILDVIDTCIIKYSEYLYPNTNYKVNYCRVVPNKYINCKITSGNRYITINFKIVWDGEFYLKVTAKDTNNESFEVECVKVEELYDIIEECFNYISS